jgi:hypothetical protein
VVCSRHHQALCMYASFCLSSEGEHAVLHAARTATLSDFMYASLLRELAEGQHAAQQAQPGCMYVCIFNA